MATNQSSIRFSLATRRQLNQLEAAGWGTITNIVSTAIDRMYQQEIKSMPTTIETKFNRSDLPEWAQNDDDIYERCKNDLAFRIAVFEAETAQRRRQLLLENRRYIEQLNNN